jgi:signal transduction histidine kinase
MDVKVKPIKGGYVLADAGRFSETVETLVKNAKEAGAKQVKITGRPLKNSYQIVVENKGAIPEDVLEKLRRFERGFTTKSTGSGIGLPGAKHTTETHGGRIFIESSKGRFGKGKTRVIILLPVKKKSSKTNK